MSDVIPVLGDNTHASSTELDVLGRALQIGAGMAIFLFVLPLMIVIAVAVMLQGRGPIIVAHQRTALDGSRYRAFKFRTLPMDADQRLSHLLATDPAAKADWDAYQSLENDPRLTPVGGFLMRSGLDTLPYVFNFMAGDLTSSQARAA